MAATALLRFGRESLELDDLAVRVEQLEQTLTLAAPEQRKLAQEFVEEDGS
jgi:hypothetical protein